MTRMEQRAAVEGKGKSMRRQRLVSGPSWRLRCHGGWQVWSRSEKSWAEQLTTCPRQLTSETLTLLFLHKPPAQIQFDGSEPFFAFARAHLPIPP